MILALNIVAVVFGSFMTALAMEDGNVIAFFFFFMLTVFLAALLQGENN